MDNLPFDTVADDSYRLCHRADKGWMRDYPVCNAAGRNEAHAVSLAANKIVFAGGMSLKEPYGSARVDIYDITTKTWTIAQLSLPSYGITAV